MPNSEVKRNIADGSVGLPHVRVGQCQVFILKTPYLGGFSYSELNILNKTYSVKIRRIKFFKGLKGELSVSEVKIEVPHKIKAEKIKENIEDKKSELKTEDKK